MTKSFGMADDDKRRVGLGAPKKGVLGAVATMPLALLGGRGGAGSGALSPTASTTSETLADSWIDFLIQQAEIADDVDQSHDQPPRLGESLRFSSAGRQECR
jgi:hypothetical protein